MLWQLAYTEIYFEKNYGLISMKRILLKLSTNLKKRKEILEIFNETRVKK